MRLGDELPERVNADRPVERGDTVQLAMNTGLFNLLWVTVTLLLIVRSGSTTGARARTVALPASSPPAEFAFLWVGGAYTRQSCPCGWAVTRKAR